MPPISLPYFLSLPATEGPWPGVVVIHEGPGISAQLLRVCERLAAEGYATVAPDLFFRTGGTESSDYTTLMGAMVPEQALADIGAAAGVLRDVGAARVGVTGFCMGGRYSWLAAAAGLGFDAAVGFYGGGIADEPGEPACPTQLFYGADDPFIPATEYERVVARYPGTIVYPGAGHGFMRDGSASYHEASATDAWERTLAFFADHLA